MAHSFTRLVYHLVFATKGRERLLAPEVRPRVFACLGGLVRELGGTAILVNGVEDHVHILARLRQDVAVSDVLRVLKSRSSRFVHKEFPAMSAFAWQVGYGAFTVSRSQEERVEKYIANQEEHHNGRGYLPELRSLLRVNGFEEEAKLPEAELLE